jgi:hypothetical protein
MCVPIRADPARCDLTRESSDCDALRVVSRGWSIEEITEEAERKAKLANTVRVPGDAETLREAIEMAREEPGEDQDEAVGGGGRVCVADSFQWNDVMVIGGLEVRTDMIELGCRADASPSFGLTRGALDHKPQPLYPKRDSFGLTRSGFRRRGQISSLRYPVRPKGIQRMSAGRS